MHNPRNMCDLGPFLAYNNWFPPNDVLWWLNQRMFHSHYSYIKYIKSLSAIMDSHFLLIILNFLICTSGYTLLNAMMPSLITTLINLLITLVTSYFNKRGSTGIWEYMLSLWIKLIYYYFLIYTRIVSLVQSP